MLLDLFCGAGGAAMGYHRAGFDIVGVDIAPQPNYPFAFIQGDALDQGSWGYSVGYRIDDFDVIHASPPCQGYSEMHNHRRQIHPRLIEETRRRLESWGGVYVIENVPGAKRHMRDPVRLCGSSFGLGVRRHRLFESNTPLQDLPCRHEWQLPRFKIYDHGRWYLARTAPVYGNGGCKADDRWAEAMGIDWMSRRELVEAIPPAYTHYLGAQIAARLEHEAAA